MTQILVAVDNSTWTAVTCPIYCKTIIFDNNEVGAVDIHRRIDSGSAATQKLIPAGMQGVWNLSSATSGGNSSTRNASFSAGQIVGYLKSVSGSFNVAVEFIE